MMDGFDAQVVKETFELNYYNATDFNEKVLPILKPNGKIVTLASMLGQLSGYSQDIAQRFRAVESKKGADEMAKEYQEAVNENIDTLQKKGWKKAAYPVSKVSPITFTSGD
jgi:carbonyl reductase 1